MACGPCRRFPLLLLTMTISGAFAPACTRRDAVAPPPRAVVRVITGTPGGGLRPLAESLAAFYQRALPNVAVTIKPSPGAVANVEAIQRGEADLGFVFADVTYTAFVGGLTPAGPPYDRVRAIAVLQLPAVHLAVRQGVNIELAAEVRGHSVGIGPEGSGTAVTAELVLRALGISLSDIRAERLPFDVAARRMVDGTLDAMFDDAIYPAEAIRTVTRAGGRLIPLVGPPIERLRRTYPFFRPTTIPADSYPELREAIRTVGVDSVLVCRRDLDEALVYDLTRLFYDALQTLAVSQRALRLMDVEQGPAAPIPLHEGAARYYRERELRR
jgi:TRAP transporter TAXI family solute receptor